MGYMSISNLYKDQTVLMFNEVYALEKVHGTSAHVSYKQEKLHFFAGGEKHETFLKIFDHDILHQKFKELGHEEVVVFGEAYGGKQQGMSGTYGKELCFIVFDVKIGDHWLSVPNAESVSQKLGLEFVPYEKVPTNVESLNFERDRPSRVAKRRGIQEDRVSEGIVIRPLVELKLSNGDRVIAKHKGESFSERASKADTKIVDPEKLRVLTEAQDIANEWVTPMRLEHVLAKLPQDLEMKDIPLLIKAMQEDIVREAEGEIVMTKQALAEIGKVTVTLFTRKLKSRLF